MFHSKPARRTTRRAGFFDLERRKLKGLDNLLGDLFFGEHATLAGVSTLRKVGLDHTHLLQLRDPGGGFVVEGGVIISGAEFAVRNLEDEIDIFHD